MGSFKFNTDRAYDNNYYRGASPETEREIEKEVNQIVDSCYENVQNLLRAKRKLSWTRSHKPSSRKRPCTIGTLSIFSNRVAQTLKSIAKSIFSANAKWLANLQSSTWIRSQV